MGNITTQVRLDRIVVPPTASQNGTNGHGPVTQPIDVEPVFEVSGLSVFYGEFRALRDVTLNIGRHRITAIIGPSGCGKSTLIRCFNRMNDLVPGARVQGQILYHGIDLYGSDVDAVEVRKRIGMVFQRPNPFPKSIWENVAFGPKVNGVRTGLDDIVEKALVQAALWDEVKDKLKQNAYSLSGGQQQRLCIARTLAVEPDVILMDEPCSALDPIATTRIEDLMTDLKASYSIVIVTHNMQQAARVSDRTVFMLSGEMVETATTRVMFTTPSDPRTEAYITGRFG